MIWYKTDCDRVNWGEMRDRLIEDGFDNGRDLAQYEKSFRNSGGVVIAYNGDEIIGTARCLTDGVCNAYVVDVWTYKPFRKQGIASEMIKLLTTPLHGQHVHLVTDDAVEFYEKSGFKPNPTGMEKVIGHWLKSEPPSDE